MNLGRFSQSVRVWCIRILMGRVEGSRWHACQALFLLTLHQQDCWCRHAVSLSWAQGIWCTVSHHLLQWTELWFVSSLWCLHRATTLSCFSSTMECWHSGLQDCLWVCMLCKTGMIRVNVSFMFLHNVLQCSTRGMCYLHIGGLIIMSVRQIVLSAVQGIILFPSGEGGNSSAEACLVFWLLNQRI